MDMKDMYTGYLHSRPSFLEGMARVMDFSGALSQYDILDIDDILANAGNGFTGADADAVAIRECWEAVGRDMQAAMGYFEQEEADALRQ